MRGDLQTPIRSDVGNAYEFHIALHSNRSGHSFSNDAIAVDGNTNFRRFVHIAFSKGQNRCKAASETTYIGTAEREKLMTENMAMMKAHMASMKAKMAEGGMTSHGDKPMAMDPAHNEKMKANMADGGMMKMDPAHMEKMKQHMEMMHQMVESLMIQQELMMPPKK